MLRSQPGSARRAGIGRSSDSARAGSQRSTTRIGYSADEGAILRLIASTHPA